jgi:signal transduction histidine kinase
MSRELGNQLSRLEYGSHLCLTHETIAEQIDATLLFIQEGLTRGDRCVIVAEAGNAEQLVRSLDDAGVNVTHESDRGALKVVTHLDISRLLSGEFDPRTMADFLRRMEAEALAAGFPGVRVAGDMAWAMGVGVPGERLIEFEILLDQQLTNCRSIVICQYDRSRFEAGLIRDVLRTHPIAILGDQVCPNPFYEPPELLREEYSSESDELKRKRVEWWIRQLRNARIAEQDRERIEAALREQAARLQVLARRVVEVQEEERRHLARELHDEIGQSLTAIVLNLQVLKGSGDPNEQARIEDSVEIVRQTINQVRGLALDLRPSMLDDFGLVPALRWLINRQAERSGLVMQFVAEPPEMVLPPDVATASFRVAQEALTNVLRHAQANHVWIDLQQEAGEVRLTVRDDGIGLDTNEVGQRALQGMSAGLLGMRERAEMLGGRLVIESVPGNGTVILVWFLVPPDASSDQAKE